MVTYNSVFVLSYCYGKQLCDRNPENMNIERNVGGVVENEKM
jgi:hypothetical protein